MSEKVQKVQMLTVKECQERTGFKRASMYKVLKHEPGVHRFFTPGSKKPIIRVESTVIDRLLNRSATRV